MKLHIKGIFDGIKADNFTWTDDWERGWNAQPKAGTRHFIGIGSASVPEADRHNLAWKPRLRQLTLWNGTKKVTLQFSQATAERLTRLIEEKLAHRLAAGTECRTGCPCRCHNR